MEYWILAYYLLRRLENPLAEVARQKDFFQTRDFRGRIYLSEEGINGQASGSREHAQEYIDWMRGDPRFQGIAFKVHASREHVFPKMTVKYRQQLVAIDCEVDFSKRGDYLSPQQWKERLEECDPQTLLLDVRNDYEWKVGHFEGAKLPQLESFRQFPSYAKALKEQKNPKTTPVLMYCTGGIRCEFYSAVLKKEGFEKVYQLEGGVIGYGLQEGAKHWKGKLFVFDDRLVVSVGQEALEPIACCRHCGTSADSYYNCANLDCNALFVSCLPCLRKERGCCTTSCLKTRAIRPYQESGKPFRKWDHRQKLAMRREAY